MANRVLVTASSKGLGLALIGELTRQENVERVVGLSASAPGGPNEVKHYRADIRDEFLLRSILEEEGIDTIYHLAFMSPETPE